MSIILFEIKRGSPLWELVQFHVKEVDGKLPIKIAELIFPKVR